MGRGKQKASQLLQAPSAVSVSPGFPGLRCVDLTGRGQDSITEACVLWSLWAMLHVSKALVPLWSWQVTPTSWFQKHCLNVLRCCFSFWYSGFQKFHGCCWLPGLFCAWIRKLLDGIESFAVSRGILMRLPKSLQFEDSFASFGNRDPL